jgi:hypothetical protein
MQHPSAWTTDLIGHRRWSHLLPITARINQLVALILALSFALLADGIEHNQSEPQLSADAGSGVFKQLKRREFKNNTKAIMDVLKDLVAGNINRTMAEVMLGGIGLPVSDIKRLIEDASDGTIDTPEEQLTDE